MRQHGYDAIVIGAGVLGCSIARSLAAGGRSVLVVDRGPGAGMGSTSASSAVIRFNYSTRVGVALAWESAYGWRAWEELVGPDDSGHAQFVRCGGLTFESPEQDFQQVTAVYDEVGVPYEVWDADRLRRTLPALNPARHHPPRPIDDPRFWDESTGVLRAMWTPDAGYVDDPRLAAHNLMTASRRLGAEFRFRAEVTSIDRDAHRVTGVTLSTGDVVRAPVVVNVSGPHSGIVNRLAGVEGEFSVRTRPLRQEVHEVRAPEVYTDHGGAVIADLDIGVYHRPTPSGGLLIGSTEPACDPLEWLEDPDGFNPRATSDRFETQVLRAARRIADLTVPNRPSGVAGVYDVADDWIPIYDRTSLEGYFVAIGTSGNQFKNAPMVGSVLTALIDAAAAGQDHDAEPVVLRLPHSGLDIDLSHYSRAREVDPASASHTVLG